VKTKYKKSWKKSRSVTLRAFSLRLCANGKRLDSNKKFWSTTVRKSWPRRLLLVKHSDFPMKRREKSRDCVRHKRKPLTGSLKSTSLELREPTSNTSETTAPKSSR
jgi:hypothetical protein